MTVLAEHFIPFELSEGGAVVPGSESVREMRKVDLGPKRECRDVFVRVEKAYKDFRLKNGPIKARLLLGWRARLRLEMGSEPKPANELISSFRDLEIVVDALPDTVRILPGVPLNRFVHHRDLTSKVAALIAEKGIAAFEVARDEALEMLDREGLQL